MAGVGGIALLSNSLGSCGDFGGAKGMPLSSEGSTGACIGGAIILGAAIDAGANCAGAMAAGARDVAGNICCIGIGAYLATSASAIITGAAALYTGTPLVGSAGTS